MPDANRLTCEQAVFILAAPRLGAEAAPGLGKQSSKRNRTMLIDFNREQLKILDAMRVFCKTLASSVLGLGLFFGWANLGAVRSSAQEILHHPVEYQKTGTGIELRSWRKVTLKDGAARKHKLQRTFFAEHAPRYHVCIIEPTADQTESPRVVKYTVRGTTISIEKSDIKSDRCYSLNTLDLIARLKQLNSNIIQNGGASGSKAIADFVARKKASGYVVSPSDPEIVRLFLESRKEAKVTSGATNGSKSMAEDAAKNRPD
jgi:hypothetical protein